MNKWWIIGAVLVSMMGMSSVARAEDPDYCAKVRARAASDAILLYAPQAQLQGIKYPAGAPGVVAVGGSESPDGYQVRGALLWSPLNAYKGSQVQSLADKDCLQHSATTQIQELLEQSADVGKAEALQRQVDYLTLQQDTIREILNGAKDRVAAGYATTLDLLPLQIHADALTRKLTQAQGQRAVLAAKGYIHNDANIRQLEITLENATQGFEDQTSKVRSLDAWTVDMSGGVVPPMMQGDPLSWYGMITVGYSFGQVPHTKYEQQYQGARGRELRAAHYEMVSQLRRFEDTVRANMSAIELDIQTLRDQMTRLQATLADLRQHKDAPNAVMAMSMVHLQIIDVESDMQLDVGMYEGMSQLYGHKRGDE